MSAVEHEIAEKGSTSTSDASTVGIAAAADFVNNDRYDDDNDVDTPRERKKKWSLKFNFYQKLYSNVDSYMRILYLLQVSVPPA